MEYGFHSLLGALLRPPKPFRKVLRFDPTSDVLAKQVSQIETEPKMIKSGRNPPKAGPEYFQQWETGENVILNLPPKKLRDVSTQWQ